MKDFREVQVTLDRAPHVYAVNGRYVVSFLVGGAAELVPEIAILPVDPAAPLLSAVVRPEILSIAMEGDARRLSVFPDGRILLRGEDDALFQDVPGRRGAHVSHGGTSVTIGPDGEVIVLAPNWALLIDRDGRTTTLDRAQGDTGRDAGGDAEGDRDGDGDGGGDGPDDTPEGPAPGGNVIRLRD